MKCYVHFIPRNSIYSKTTLAPNYPISRHSVPQQATPHQNSKIRSVFVERTFRQSLRRSMHISHTRSTRIFRRQIYIIHFFRSDARNVPFVPPVESRPRPGYPARPLPFHGRRRFEQFQNFSASSAKNETVTHLHAKSSFRSVYLAIFCSASVLRDSFPASSSDLTLRTSRASFLSRFYFGNEENAIDRADQRRDAFTGENLRASLTVRSSVKTSHSRIDSYLDTILSP